MNISSGGTTADCPWYSGDGIHWCGTGWLGNLKVLNLDSHKRTMGHWQVTSLLEFRFGFGFILDLDKQMLLLESISIFNVSS